MKTLIISSDGFFSVECRNEGKSIFSLTDDAKIRVNELFALDLEDDAVEYYEIDDAMYTEIEGKPLGRVR